MLSTLLAICLVAALLYLIFYIFGRFAPGLPHRIAGIVLAIIFALYSLNRLGILNSINL